MKPPPFAYFRATSVDEALDALSRHEGDAKLLAGGQSLIPMLNMRLVSPAMVIDINGIAALSGIRVADGEVRIGAMVRYSVVERSVDVMGALPLLSAAMRLIGDRQIRNRGTVGGSLAHGDPTSETAVASLALGARVVIAGPGGLREVPLSGLYLGPYMTVLKPTEMIVEVIYPDASDMHWGFAEHCRRHGDFAVVGVAGIGKRNADGTWTGVRIALGGVAPTPILAAQAGASLEGTRLEPEAISRAGRLASEETDPPSDGKATAEYRRHLLPVYVERVLSKMDSRGAAA
jgi:carbon-monoxide dehydrogenase medium subunit